MTSKSFRGDKFNSNASGSLARIHVFALVLLIKKKKKSTFFLQGLTAWSWATLQLNARNFMALDRPQSYNVRIASER